MNFSEFTNEIYNKAEELADVDRIYKFLTESISKETLERFMSIDWNSFTKEETPPYRWNTCNGENPEYIKFRLARHSFNDDPDSFIRELNNLLGNCCINNIYDLDNV